MAEDTFEADATDETLGTGSTGDGAEILYAWQNQGLSEDVYARIYFDVYDTIGAASTITAAAFWFYSIGYSTIGSKPATAEQGEVSILDENGSRWYVIQDFEGGPGDGYDDVFGDGWNEITLDASARSYIGSRTAINPTGYDTAFMFEVDDPGASRARKWEIAAYENDDGGSTGDWAAYLVVTYTEASGDTARVMIISC